MKKLLSPLLASCLVLSCLVLSGCTSAQSPIQSPAPSPETESDENAGGQGEQEIAPASIAKIYLVALEDEGKSGIKLDNGDSLVGVEKVLDNPEQPLEGALEALLAIKQQYYGQSGLYNALYQSDLKVDRIDIANGEAGVYLSGATALGGVMDIPRVKGQLEQTVLQFSSLKSVKIYVNDQPLDQVLSLKGE